MEEEKKDKNLRIYNRVRTVPEEAKKPITGGDLKGKTDINPMWRIKTLTEIFGPVGLGWWYDIINKWSEEHDAISEVGAFVEIDLYVKYDNEWSKPIRGIGGSQIIKTDKRGTLLNDEAYKMALTDAISVSCKALGIGADVYWGEDSTKYDKTERHTSKEYKCCDCGQEFKEYEAKGKKYSAGQAFHIAEKINKDGKARCRACRKKLEAEEQKIGEKKEIRDDIIKEDLKKGA